MIGAKVSTIRPQLGLGEEYVPPGEAAAHEKIARMIEDQVKHDYPSGKRPTLRGQHAKAHGCVRAEFIVEDNVPEQFRYGLFKEPRTYPAWIRFSSSSSAERPDTRKDAHGMAIKLMGVEGEKLLPAEKDETTHDFLLVDSRVFFIRNADDYVTFVRAFTDTNTGKKIRQLLSFFFGGNPLR